MYDIKNKPDYLLIDYRVSENIKNNLKKLDYKFIETQENINLYEEIKGHPDIMACPLKSQFAVVEKNLFQKLKKYDLKIINGSSNLSKKYPKDIQYNFTTVNNYIIGKIKNIDENLKKEIDKINIHPIEVNQGYCKCNILVLNTTAIVTGDRSIYKAMENIKDINCYYVQDDDIYLSHRYKGFIGGCAGLLKPNLIGFFGELEKMSFSKELKEILKRENIQYINLDKGILRDYGSIVPLYKK